ncbi:peptidase S10 serine carboxypeptidase [Polyporus arcularius HHB13444]|uniref:Carboxypeptidase n=1 Tax=Polyporus arcularius HHB13444 TaxID=1314778 RepID=A0A5C3P9D9_9APHY|nr:peptidase S10 serine carboxypeptidase [Polyporus arcularius HHB13444]
MFKTAAALAWIALGVVVSAQQVAFDVGASIRPVGTVSLPGNVWTRYLADITSHDAFVALRHPRFPAHQVRVKKSEFCDPTVNVYTGYLDVDEGAKHLFFYFFESRRNPDSDDVMMWINGGPGCSSSMGLLMELGPCRIDMKNASSNGTTWNPYSWNAETNILFLDQPVGVGFSYAEFGETIETTEDAAKNVHAFLTIFFETFSQSKGRPLHLAGESYAGRYLPAFASYVYDQNQVAIEEGRDTLNLTSVLIGNGIVDISMTWRGRYEVECTTASLEVPFQKISTCVRQKTALPRCEKAIRESCVDIFDAINCRAAVSFCEAEVSAYYESSGRNFYDVNKPCLGDLCYLEVGAIKSYLDDPSVRALLGVESPGNFSSCSSDVGRGFNVHLDKYSVPSQFYIAGLLERGVRTLIYSGTHDWQCSWPATRLWLDKLEWTGAVLYKSQTFRDWTVDGHKAGEVRTAGPLTFATVRGAGHMVPFDKPAEAQAMVSRWLAQEDLQPTEVPRMSYT